VEEEIDPTVLAALKEAGIDLDEQRRLLKGEDKTTEIRGMSDKEWTQVNKRKNNNNKNNRNTKQ
jgi:hypothetical protein